jgi:hypothetical protein
VARAVSIARAQRACQRNEEKKAHQSFCRKEAPSMIENLPEEGLSFEPPIDFFHLTGGSTMMISCNKLSSLLLPRLPGMVFFSCIFDNNDFQDISGNTEIRILGGNRIFDVNEMNDVVTANFRTSIKDKSHDCLASSQAIHWGGVAISLRRRAKGKNYFLASRLSNQIRMCLSRIERLSIAYRIVLSNAQGQTSGPDKRQYSSNKYSSYIGSEYRSTINELYSLRDATINVYYHLKFSNSESFSIRKVKNISSVDLSRSSELIYRSMFKIDGDLLIDKMSMYRNIPMHCLGQSSPLFGDMYEIRSVSTRFGDMEYLSYPLYDDIDKMRDIERGSSLGAFDDLPKTEAERFLSKPIHLDALEFCYDCFERLLRICEALSEEINIDPETHVITEKELIDLHVTDEQGNTRRYRRDGESGPLVEY